MNNSTLARIRQLKTYYDSGQIPRLEIHEVHPGLDKDERLNYLYFTLPVSINFQRSSPAMWQSALKTFNDSETNFVFYPEKVINESREKIQEALVKHNLALLRNKHTDIWIVISKTLFEEYNSDPKEIIKEGQNCVVRIKNIIQDRKKKSFPYLSGAKMANYWLYILHNFTDIKLRNLHKISIIPDTHVIQCTEKLGLSNEKLKPYEIAEIWDKILKDSAFVPIDLHPVLWNWSRADFKPEV